MDLAVAAGAGVPLMVPFRNRGGATAHTAPPALSTPSPTTTWTLPEQGDEDDEARGRGPLWRSRGVEGGGGGRPSARAGRGARQGAGGGCVVYRCPAARRHVPRCAEAA